MFKLNEDGFCDLCGCHTDHKDLHSAEDQDCNKYHACGYCKETLESEGQIDNGGYMILSHEQITALENGGVIIQGGAVIKICDKGAAA